MSEPIVVDFPLRGEWVAPATPGKKVPSHGTNWAGQRYAYDFVRTDPAAKGIRFHKRSLIHYLIRGVRLQDCFGWGQPIYSPVSGVVIQAGDGWPERQPVHFVNDLVLPALDGVATLMKHALTRDRNRTRDFRYLAGNHLIIETSDAYAFLAHARTGSIRVSAKEAVSRGQLLAEVGHSGNSAAPHLHFHLMDRVDLQKAQGIPCCFREYEVYRDGNWKAVENGIPKHTERIRKL